MDNNILEEYNVFKEVKISKDLIPLVKEMEEKFPQMTTEFKDIMINNYVVFLKKQHDYGPYNISMNTNLQTQEDKILSLTGLVVRINDKVSRLVNLILKNKNSKNESVYDTFLDLSVYGIISMIVLNNKWGK